MMLGNRATAVTLDSVPHIHHVKVIENKILVLTHEGLYELVGKNDMKLIGKDRIDVMGFTSLGKLLFASGHPAKGSKMPNPIGEEVSQGTQMEYDVLAIKSHASMRCHTVKNKIQDTTIFYQKI